MYNQAAFIQTSSIAFSLWKLTHSACGFVQNDHFFFKFYCDSDYSSKSRHCRLQSNSIFFHSIQSRSFRFASRCVHIREAPASP